MKRTYEVIYEQQRTWADQLGIAYDKDGYTCYQKDNLYCKISEKTLSEFKAGKGAELGGIGKRGKMQALHSSSALVLNIFEYWRQSNHIDEIAKACGAPRGMTTMQFEQTYPILAGGTPPTLMWSYPETD